MSILASCKTNAYKKSDGTSYCAFTIKDSLNWFQADEACKLKGGRLPDIESVTQNNEILKLKVLNWVGTNSVAPFLVKSCFLLLPLILLSTDGFARIFFSCHFMPWRGFKLRRVTLRPGTFWRTLYQLSHRVEAFLWKVIAKGFVENVTLHLFSAIRFKHLAWCNWSEKRRKVEVGSFRWGTSFQSLRVWRTQRRHPWQLLGDAAGQR